MKRSLPIIVLALLLSLYPARAQSPYAFGTLSGTSITSAGSILSNGTAGVGYATGAGGAVTQLTSKATGVTLNKISGAVTMVNTALAANTSASFTVTNNTVAATDVPLVAIKSGATANAYIVNVGAVAAGSFIVQVRNVSAGSLSEAVVISFVVIKGVAS